MDELELEIAIAEEEARAKALAMSQQAPAETEAPSFNSTPEKGFWGELAGGADTTLGNIGQWASDIAMAPVHAVEGLGNFAMNTARTYTSDPASRSMGVMGLPLAAGKTFFSGVESVEDAAMRVRDTAASAIPGARTALQYGSSVLSPGADADDKTPAKWGKALREDLAFAPTMGLAARASHNRGVRNARTAAEEAALADPTSQAAIRYAQNRQLLNTQSAKDALARGEVTTELSDAAGIAQREAQTLNRPASPQYPDVPAADYLPGNALGYPESSASTRPFAASEEMGRAGPTIIESGVYQGSERINPYTGKFDGPPSAPVNAAALQAKMDQAAVDIIATRKTTVNALDQALQAINQQSPGAPKVRGIMFDVDMAPMLDELRGVIDKRSMLAQTEPMGGAMKNAMNAVEQSFDAVKNNSLMSRWNKIGPDGSRQLGELTPTEALSMIENMNAFRKSLGEFDELAKSNSLNSTHNDFAGRAAELYSLSKVQSAAQAALEAKASEILKHVPSVRGFYQWQDALAPVTDATLDAMNKTYSAFQTAKEAAATYNNTTNRGMVTPEQGRLITAAKQGQEIGAQAVEAVVSPQAFGLKKFVNAIWGDKGPPYVNPALSGAQQNAMRPQSGVSQVLDGLLLREKPVPILSRNWERVRLSSDSLLELRNRAETLGIIGPGIFETLSDPMKKELHKIVIQAAPQAAEAMPGGYNVINDEFANPMERDAYTKDALNKSPSERAKLIGSGSMQNKFVPPTTNQTPPVPQVDTNQLTGGQVDLGSLNQSLTIPELSPEQPDYSYNKSHDAVIAELEAATMRHSQDYN